jgi:hypothetical protein
MDGLIIIPIQLYGIVRDVETKAHWIFSTKSVADILLFEKY